MTTHKVRKIYGENVCMVCARSWEDGDEVPECHPTPKVPYTRYVGKEYQEHELGPQPTPAVKAFFLHNTKTMTAVVCYAKSRYNALSLGERFFKGMIDKCEEVGPEYLRYYVEGRDPYIEASPRNVLRLREHHLTPRAIKIVGPMNFKRENL